MILHSTVISSMQLNFLIQIFSTLLSTYQNTYNAFIAIKENTVSTLDNSLGTGLNMEFMSLTVYQCSRQVRKRINVGYLSYRVMNLVVRQMSISNS
jgi:hypothetical protein